MTAMPETDLIERLKAGVPCSGTHETCDDVDAATGTMREAAEYLTQMETRLHAAEFAARNGESLSSDAIHAIRELLKAHDVPLAAFIDDHVGNAIAQRDEARARLASCEAANDSMFRVFLVADDDDGDDEVLTFSLKSEMDAFLKAQRDEPNGWTITDIHEYQCSTAISARAALTKGGDDAA